ncbi:MAG: hypothetical protein JWO86_215 [Myxococcaceae bacterium]|jgi:hypothetical protein|nr:hypothetical protein [Myxococcaceae bacterium]MEA2751417.1 hypothetical protein [Myxococcales bacterium]
MTEALDQRSHVTVSPSVYARAFGAEIVLLDFSKGEYFGLDAIGADIWRRLEAGDDLGATADHLVARYEVGRDEALRDIVDLVTQLRNYGLLGEAE